MSLVKEAVGAGLRSLWGNPTDASSSSSSINKMYSANEGLANAARSAKTPLARSRAVAARGKLGKILDAQRQSARSVGLSGSRF